MAASPVPEPKIGVVPRVVKHGFGSVREYSVLLTDRRMIFVMASLSRAHLAAAALGGALGAAVVAGRKDASPTGLSHVSSEEPEALATMEGSIVIPYSAIQEIRLKKYPADYELIVDHRDERGKKDRLRVQVSVPDAYAANARAAGLNNKTMWRNYASEIQAELLRALPPNVAAVARWDF